MRKDCSSKNYEQRIPMRAFHILAKTRARKSGDAHMFLTVQMPTSHANIRIVHLPQASPIVGLHCFCCCDSIASATAETSQIIIPTP